MGVPKQVADMEAEGDKEIAETTEAVASKPTAGTVAAPSQDVVKEAEHASDAHTEDGKSLLSEIGNHTASDEEQRKEAQREASAQGRLNKLNGQMRAQREAYEGKIAELENRISELDAKLKNVRIGNAPADDCTTDDEAFAAIRKEYSEDEYSDEDLKRFLGVINKATRRNFQVFQRRFDEMDAEKADRAKRAAKAEADGFVEKLNADFPGFREMDANNDPRWISFLGTSLGGVMEGTTYGDVAKDALGKLDYRKFASVVREFAKHANIVFSDNATPADGSVTGQIRPNNVAVRQRESTQALPRTVPAAEIEAFRKAAFAHKAEERYGMTPNQVVEQLRFYEDAEAEGRVR